MNKTGNDIFTARLVAGAIGADRFNDLIISLPREFFELDADDKAQAWRAALKAANGGERNVAELADTVRHFLSS